MKVLGLAILLGLGGSASAERVGGIHRHPMGNGGMCGTGKPSAPSITRALPHHHVGRTIFLNRCVGGCSFTGAGSHDAANNLIAIVGTTPGAAYSFGEFTSFANQPGAAADAEWNAIVACVAKVYSYYNVQVTDVRPTSGTYHVGVVSGIAGNLFGGNDESLLGISDVECAGPIDNMTSFNFAESHKRFAGSSQRYVNDLCSTIAHEAGHSFGLEHEFEFVDGSSACTDPMSYDTGACNPAVRFFRNKPAKCGGFELMPCFCSAQAQNSHTRLNTVFGPGIPAIGTPIVQVTTPQPNQQLAASIIASAGHERGIDRVELYINNFKWAQLPGAAFITGGGQPNPGPYVFPVPAGLPNSIVDITIRIYDDLGNMTESPVVTAMKGSACADASTCAEGQKCEAGRCFWDPPIGEVGDSCDYPQYCKSNLCQGTDDVQICTQPCVIGSADSCPADAGLTCISNGAGGGICFRVEEDTGWCSTSDGSWAPFGMVAFVLGLFAFRRRRPLR